MPWKKQKPIRLDRVAVDTVSQVISSTFQSRVKITAIVGNIFATGRMTMTFRLVSGRSFSETTHFLKSGNVYRINSARQKPLFYQPNTPIEIFPEEDTRFDCIVINYTGTDVKCYVEINYERWEDEEK